jgi:Domain of unknown function (DUF4340)
MKLKHTLILLVLAVGFAAYVQLVDKKIPTTKEREEKKGRLFEFDRDKITAIAIKTPETKIELKKAGQNWLVETPVKDRADSTTVTSLLTSVELLRSESTIDNEGKGVGKDQLKEFGIADSQTKVTLTVDGKPVELVFGKDTTMENRVYAHVDGTKTVEVVSSTLRNDISKKADEFRDKKLSDLTLSQITKAVIKTQAGEIETERKDDHWSIVRPLKARGDDAKVGDVVSQAISARIDAFVADTSKLAEYGLDQPRGTITLTVEGQQQPQVLSIGGSPKDEKDKEKVYAKLSSRDAVVLLPKSIAGLLDTKPNDLRDKKLALYNNDLVDRITIEPAGKEKLVFARDGAKNWVRKTDKDVAINASLVTRLLDELGAATVANFVADVATELPKYGLDQPALKVTLSAFSSENTAETKAGEKPIVALFFGKIEGDNVYAKTDDEPFVLATPKAILDAIPTDAIQLQPLEIFKHKSDDIVSLEVSREGQPTFTLERDKDKNWKLAKGDDKLNTINVQSLVNTLASLRAVRWVGATTAAHGFDKPVATVSFKTASNIAGKLTLGGENPDKMRFAKADGLEGTFLIANPDFEAFVTGLTEKATTATQPAQTGAAPAPGAPDAKPKIEAVTPPVSVPPDAVPAPVKPAPSEAPKPQP